MMCLLRMTELSGLMRTLKIYDDLIDAMACVTPGLVDAHCHLRDPGHEYKEDIESGTKRGCRRIYLGGAWQILTRD